MDDNNKKAAPSAGSIGSGEKQITIGSSNCIPLHIPRQDFAAFWRVTFAYADWVVATDQDPDRRAQYEGLACSALGEIVRLAREGETETW